MGQLGTSTKFRNKNLNSKMNLHKMNLHQIQEQKFELKKSQEQKFGTPKWNSKKFRNTKMELQNGPQKSRIKMGLQNAWANCLGKMPGQMAWPMSLVGCLPKCLYVLVLVLLGSLYGVELVFSYGKLNYLP